MCQRRPKCVHIQLGCDSTLIWPQPRSEIGAGTSKPTRGGGMPSLAPKSAKRPGSTAPTWAAAAVWGGGLLLVAPNNTGRTGSTALTWVAAAPKHPEEGGAAACSWLWSGLWSVPPCSLEQGLQVLAGPRPVSRAEATSLPAPPHPACGPA